MEFYDVIEKRKTVREFLDKPVDFEKIKRILEAGNLAPTWNHNRNWSYIPLILMWAAPMPANIATPAL